MELKKQDLEEIEKLLRVTGSIYEQYQDFDTTKKEQILSTIKLEDAIIDRLAQNNKQNAIIASHLLDRVSSVSLIDKLLGNKDEMIIQRIIYKLEERLQEDEDTCDLVSHLKIKNQLNADIFNIMLSILSKDKELSEFKYRIAFLIPTIEQKLLEKDFEIEENPYVLTLLISQSYFLESERTKQRISVICQSEVLQQILKILTNKGLDDEAISDNVLRQYYIRSLLTQLSQEDTANLYEMYELAMNKSFANNPTAIISSKLVEQAFASQVDDKSIPKTLSFKK